MPKYSVTGAVHASTYIGDYDANTPEEAIELAYNDAGISLCHECAREVSDPEVCELVAEDVETGDATSEATTNDQIVEQAAEIKRLRAENERLRAALADIARGDYSDPLSKLTPEQRTRVLADEERRAAQSANNPHRGSTFDSWLDEEGIRDEVEAAAKGKP